MKKNNYDEEDYYDDEYDYDYDDDANFKPQGKKVKQTQPQKNVVQNNTQNKKTNKIENVKKNTASTNANKDNKQNSPSKKTDEKTVSNANQDNNSSKTHQVHKKENSEERIKHYNSSYPVIDYHIEKNLEEKSLLNLVIIGHVDSGKSTLMGHLLYLLGEVDEKTMHKYEKESKMMKKNTFQFAWALDEGEEERKRGVTMDIAFKSFSTKTKKVNIMDAPGHKDFIPNMISGASFADCAILVIDSSKSGFDAGFFQGGQTKEHAILARSLGIGQVIVAINKLDLWDWSKERFEYVKYQVEAFLSTLDFKEKDVKYVPVSGLSGVNLKERGDTKQLAWYEGKTLLEYIDEFNDPVRNLGFPMRFSVNDCGQSKIENLQGFSVFGRVEGGVIFENTEYLLQPLNLKVKVKALGTTSTRSDVLKCGETGEAILLVDELTSNQIKSGNILSSIEHPIPVINQFRAQILSLDITMPLTKGQELFLHCQSQKSIVKLKNIDKLFSKNGDVAKTNSKFIPKNYSAVIVLELEKSMCLETYSNLKSLGRITLRDGGSTVAAGIILEIIQ